MELEREPQVIYIEVTPQPTPQQSTEEVIVETTSEVTNEASTNPSILEVTPAPVKPSQELAKESLETSIKSFGTLQLHQFNVGCADAYLLRTDDITIMIDGAQKDSTSAGNNLLQRVLNYLENAGVTKIDIYIATHWHGDHSGNMEAILAKFGTSETKIYGNSPKMSSDYSVPTNNGSYLQMKDGDEFEFGHMHLKCVGPYKVFQGKNNENYNSLNFLVTFGETKILMTGDYIHKEVLENYSAELKNIDVYKMAHHGLKVSNYSGSPNVLPHLNPKVVLVPANSSNPTRTLLSNLGIVADVYDNQSGNILVTSDGSKIRVATEK